MSSKYLLRINAWWHRPHDLIHTFVCSSGQYGFADRFNQHKHSLCSLIYLIVPFFARAIPTIVEIPAAASYASFNNGHKKQKQKKTKKLCVTGRVTGCEKLQFQLLRPGNAVKFFFFFFYYACDLQPVLSFNLDVGERLELY